MKPRTSGILKSAAAALVLLALLVPAARAEAGEDERFVYRWELKKLAALVGGILVPGQGEGLLTFERRGDDRLLSELLITSEHSDEGEFWRYGAEIDRRAGRTLKAWSSYLWRGESKSESAEIDQRGVIDIASGIFQIRRDLPEEPVRMRIWSDGKIYPVLVVPKGETTRTVPGARVEARHYRIQGLDLPGERKWKGHMDLWLAKDADNTPIEIRFDRSLVGVHLKLDQPL